jgi:hypothetical protein
MPRPNRLYTIDGKYYYIKDGKKVFVKVPAGVTQKQVSKINIKNIIKLAETKRVVRKKKRRNLSYQKKIAPVLQKSETGGLPIYFFKPQKNIPTLEELAKASDDTNVEKLSKLLLKGITATPSSSKLPTEPTIATPAKELTFQEKAQAAYEKEMAKRNQLKADDEAARQAAIAEIRRKKGKTSMKPTVGGVATTITESKIETGITPSKEQVRASYPPGADISTPKIEKATAEARTRPGFLQRMFSPGKVGPSPGEKADKNLKGTPAPSRNLSAALATVEEEETTPITIRRTGTGHDTNDGLYDDEIETIAKKRLKDYIPVIAKDETQELMKYVKTGDKQFGFVINTDNSDQPGRHWRCVYINNRDDYPSIEYFDPLTEGKPEQSLIDICRKIAIKMNPEKLFKYKQNQIRRQSKLSSNCGYHCIHFLEGRYMGIPFSEITGYDEFVDKMKKQNGELDGSGQGESELKPFMKKYDSYI